jgi:hypothetical protein
MALVEPAFTSLCAGLNGRLASLDEDCNALVATVREPAAPIASARVALEPLRVRLGAARQSVDEILSMTSQSQLACVPIRPELEPQNYRHAATTPHLRRRTCYLFSHYVCVPDPRCVRAPHGAVLPSPRCARCRSATSRPSRLWRRRSLSMATTAPRALRRPSSATPQPWHPQRRHARALRP